MSNIQENSIEKYLKKRVEEAGGKAYKFVSPGVSGVADRICVLPGNIIFFVETKAPGKDLRPLQKVQARALRQRGAHLWVASSKDEIDLIIEKECKCVEEISLAGNTIPQSAKADSSLCTREPLGKRKKEVRRGEVCASQVSADSD